MKNKKPIIILVLILLIVGVISWKSFSIKPSKKLTIYETILERMNNGESFNLLIGNGKREDLKQMLDYYSDAYGLKIIYLKSDINDTNYSKILLELGLESPVDEQLEFQIIRNGKPYSGTGGILDESEFQAFFIKQKLISEEYKDIDHILSFDFKAYYNQDKTYCVLYDNLDSESSYKFRKLLVKNKINSLILYIGSSDISTVEYLKKQLGLDRDFIKKLPIAIKIRNNQVLSSVNNVTLDNLVDSCK